MILSLHTNGVLEHVTVVYFSIGLSHMKFTNLVEKVMLGVFPWTSSEHLSELAQPYHLEINSKQNIRELTHALVPFFLSDRRQGTVLNGKAPHGHTHGTAGVSQSSILGPSLFLIYINDLLKIVLNTKLFADYTSVFFVIHDSHIFANDLNKDLEMIHSWDFQWKMNFNPDPTKQA